MSTSQPTSSGARLRQKQTPQSLFDTVDMHPASEEAMPERIGNLLIRRCVGRGGFGIVYAAYDEGLGKEVAVKVPRAQLIPNQILIDRFVREMHSGSLDHPNILTVLQAGTDNHVPYLVMPLCEGTDLGNWLARRNQDDKALPTELVLHWVIQITKAVDYAHKRGVLHRDLKPSNIMLDQSTGSTNPYDWVPRLTDFGLAKALTSEDKGSSLTKQGDILGTPEYMSPEQLAGDVNNIGVATDVHGLGTILHELVYGVSPYGGHDRTNTLFKVINLAPQYPTTMKRRVPPDLRAVIEKCLEKKPEDRFQSASELLEELEKVRDGKPTRTRPLTWLGHGLRWGWRHPIGALAAGIIAVLLAILGIGIVKYQLTSLANVKELQENNKRLQEKEQERVHTIGASLMREAFSFYNDGRTDLALDRLNQPEVQGTMPLVEGLLRYQLMNRQVVYYPGHFSRVDHMAISTNERYIITRSHDENVLLTDLVTGTRRSLAEPGEMLMLGHTGHRSIFINQRGQACVWHAQDERRLHRHTLAPLTNTRHVSIACSADRTQIFATQPEIGLIWYDARQQQTLLVPWPKGLEPRSTRSSSTLWCSPTGNWLIIEQVGKGYLSWHRDEPEKLVPLCLMAPLDGPQNLPIQAISFQEQRDELHAWVYPHHRAHFRRKPHLVTVATCPELGRCSYNLGPNPENRMCCLDRDNSNMLYTGNRHGEVIAVDLAGGQVTTLIHHASEVQAVLHGAPGELLILDEAMLFAYDLRSRAITQTWKIPDSLRDAKVGDFLNWMQYFPSERALLVAGNDGRIARWNLTYQQPETLWHRERSEVHGIAFSHDSRLLATGADNGDVHLWDPQTRKLIRSIDKAHDVVVMSLCFTPDGQSLFSSSYDGDIKQWNVATGTLVQTYVGPHVPIRSMAYSPKHRRLFAGCREGFLITWEEGQPNKCLWRQLHEDNIKGFHLSADESRLYTGGEDFTIKCLDPATGRQQFDFNDQQESWCIVERGSQLHTAGAAAHLSVFDRLAKHKIADFTDTFNNHSALVVSSNGEYMISAGESAPIRFWNVRTRHELGMLNTMHEMVFMMALSPDDKYLAVACKSGKVLIYPVGVLPVPFDNK